MTERELTAEVIKICNELGLLWHHCPNSSRCNGSRGFPDLVIAGPTGMVIAELKSDDGETTADQDLWLWCIAQVAGPGLQRWLWRPADLASGHIRKALEGIRS